MALKGCCCWHTDIWSGGLFRSSYRGRSRGSVWFQVHPGWFQFDLCSSVSLKFEEWWHMTCGIVFAKNPAKFCHDEFAELWWLQKNINRTSILQHWKKNRSIAHQCHKLFTACSFLLPIQKKSAVHLFTVYIAHFTQVIIHCNINWRCCLVSYYKRGIL